MRVFLMILACAVLLFGCTGGGSPQPPGAAPGPVVQPDDDCEAKYSFSELGEGTLGMNTKVVATVTCAMNKTVALSLNGETKESVVVESDAATPVELEFAPDKDGAHKLEITVEGETVFSRDWTVKPLGSDDTRGVDNDAISFKEWRAMSVPLDQAINAGKVKLFLKRISEKTQPGTMVVVDLREDNNGKPGAIIASSEKPISTTTLSDNWITFDFPQKPRLSAGTKWIVVRIKQTEDVTLVSDNVNLHYVTVDRQAEGNDYTKQMILSVDTVGGIATETEWTPLSYDRVYTMTLSSG